MGTDIHAVVQVRKDGAWETKLDWPNPYYGRIKDDPPTKARWLSAVRNYPLFSILADVRNGRGFAGIRTGDGYEPLSSCRGFPAGFELDEDDTHCGVWMGDHSFTWVTLAELQRPGYWEQRTKCCGTIGATERARMLETKATRPDNWCGGVSGPGIYNVSLQELDGMLEGGELQLYPNEPLKDRYYAVVEWEESYADSVQWFLDEYMPQLEALGAPEDVRIVMGFDS